jgi:hypothetical protein
MTKTMPRATGKSEAGALREVLMLKLLMSRVPLPTARGSVKKSRQVCRPEDLSTPVVSASN